MWEEFKKGVVTMAAIVVSFVGGMVVVMLALRFLIEAFKFILLGELGG